MKKRNDDCDKLTRRRISRRQFLAISGVGVAGMYLAGFRPLQVEAETMPAEAPTTGQTLVVGFATGPNGLDHEFHKASRSTDVYRNCGVCPLRYEPMAVGDVFQSDFTKLVGDTAKEWKIGKDWSSVTITFREGIRSPTGNELTADDLIYRYQRSWGLKGTEWGFTKDSLLMTGPDSVKKEGKYTYTINMSGPNALAEMIQAHNGTQIYDSVEYQKHATADDPWSTKWAGSNFAGHGPWKVTDYKPGQSWTLERNENYFSQGVFTGNITKVMGQIIPASANRVALLQSGDIDMAFDLNASELITLSKTPGVRVDHLPGNHLQWMGFSLKSDKSPELKDVNVRLAIANVLPFDLLLERPYLGLATQMKSTVAPAYAGYDVVSQIWGDRKRDVSKAKDYLSKSPYPKGFKTTLHYDINMPGQEETAIIIKSALAEIGIDVEILKVQSGDFFNLAFGPIGFPGMMIYRDMAGTPDVNFGTHLWLKSGHCCAPGNYSNQDIDKLYSQAQGSPGQFEKRVDLQRQIDDIAINKDPMGVPLQAVGFHAACRQNVGGFWWQSLNEILWAKAWKK